ncbi:MAG: type II toxin-antitoxin system VapC family toxin [Candidatus Kapabacteria bacterium]|nr:type II toxin-antitoxin system VapC family toxin [Candidatus Kapabacteria bacterium]
MDLLLDTHTLIWFLNGENKLSANVLELITSESNRKFISIASLWEIAIKINLKKLSFDGNVNEIASLIDENGFEILQINIEHLKTYETLELIHRDPFDRILVAQAIVNNMSIITKDSNIRSYSVESFW